MDESQQWASVLGVPIDAGPPDICRAFESLAGRLCPAELGPGGLPVYAVCTSMLPASFKVASKFIGGWHAKNLHSWLHDAGAVTWRGHGPSVLAHDCIDDRQTIRQAAIQRLGERAKATRLTIWISYWTWSRPSERAFLESAER